MWIEIDWCDYYFLYVIIESQQCKPMNLSFNKKFGINNFKLQYSVNLTFTSYNIKNHNFFPGIFFAVCHKLHAKEY